MGPTKTLFVWMFFCILLILGVLFGTFVVAPYHQLLALLIIPSIIGGICGAVGFLEVFTS